MSRVLSRRTLSTFVLFAASAAALPAQVLTTLHSFGVSPDGRYPLANLVQGTDGNLYGTTNSGGTNLSGTIFKITPSGKLSTLYEFCPLAQCPDGSIPYGGLVQGADGNFYGTTYSGGINNGGTIFKFTPSGKFQTLYEFCSRSGCPDGQAPLAGLVQAADGLFYGTTYLGGATASGTIFKITPSGTLTTLHRFCSQAGCLDGRNPQGALVQGLDGDLYGTTAYGGNSQGTIFKITSGGTLTTLFSFCSRNGCPDGAFPEAGLVQDLNTGDFYGTTTAGGTHVSGTIFEITPSGSLTTLHTFCSQTGCADGSLPFAGLIHGTDGDFYGTTSKGGVNSSGTIFQITPFGSMATLYSFCSQTGCPDGSAPEAPLVQDTNGDFYGTTFSGGVPNNAGTVFRFSVNLGPFVRPRPHAGSVGAVISLLGTNLAGATNVSFNGISAPFTIVSPTLIRATIPAGATTGEVEVTTPAGTLSSGGPFLVEP